MLPLHIAELLPGWQRWPYFPSMRFSVWCLSCGFLVALLVAILWQPRRAVFLDRICISEDNSELKTFAIFSNAVAGASLIPRSGIGSGRYSGLYYVRPNTYIFPITYWGRKEWPTLVCLPGRGTLAVRWRYQFNALGRTSASKRLLTCGCTPHPCLRLLHTLEWRNAPSCMRQKPVATSPAVESPLHDTVTESGSDGHLKACSVSLAKLFDASATQGLNCKI